MLPYQPADAFALPANHDCGWTNKIRIPIDKLTARIGTGNPYATLFEVFESVHHIHDLDNWHVFQGTSCCFGCGLRESGRPSFGNDYTMYTGNFGCSEYRTKISRVFYTIKDKEQRCLPF